MREKRVIKQLQLLAHRWFKRLWMIFAVLVIFSAILMTFFRVMTPWINQHKSDVEQQLSHLLGEQVTIQSMETGWSWFQPMLKLDRVLVSENGVPALQLNKLLVGVSLWNSLLHWQIQPGILLIDDVQITLRQTETGWQVDGIRQGEQLPAMTPKSYLPVIQWLLLQHKIKIQNVSAVLHLQDGTIIPVDSLTIQAAHRRDRYYIKGKATLGKEQKTELSLKGNISFLSNLLETTEGELFFFCRSGEFFILEDII